MDEATKKSEAWKKWLSLAILCLGAGMIYMIPYIQYSYYKPMQDALKISNEQLGRFLSVYGIIALIVYFPGGWIADRVSVKKLLAFSFLATGISGFYFATFPPYGIVMALFVFWGITTILTFWAAMIKAVRMLGDSEEQGSLYGLLEGGRGLFTTIVGFITVAVFAKLGSNTIGFRGVIIIYASFITLSGILTLVLFEEKKIDVKTGILIEDVFKVIKMPKVWLVALIIFSAYSITASSSYLIPFLQDIFKVSAAVAATLGIIRNNVMQLIGGPSFGIIGDKINSRPKMVLIGFILAAIFLVLFLILPGKPNLLIIAIAIMILLMFAGYGLRGVYFSIIDDAKVPIAVTGAAAGFVSLIGFIPDTFIYNLYGVWLDKYKGIVGYHHIFTYMLAMAIVGSIVSYIFIVSTRNNNKNGDVG
jgi:predicted MFS family arabinose efflux permease